MYYELDTRRIDLTLLHKRSAVLVETVLKNIPKSLTPEEIENEIKIEVLRLYNLGYFDNDSIH